MAEEGDNETHSFIDEKDSKKESPIVLLYSYSTQRLLSQLGLLPLGSKSVIFIPTILVVLCCYYIIVAPNKADNPIVVSQKQALPDKPCFILKEDGSCACWNPLIARPRGDRNRQHKVSEQFDRSFKHNLYLVEQVRNVKDVVFFGDSIIEGWMGTVYREVKNKEKAAVYREFFEKNEHGGKFDGLVLGIAGDQTANLLWRLQNGELPDSLQSKVFWVLIGTNDFGHTLCPDDVVYTGIIGVVEYLQSQRPDSVIVVNSLLPRRDEIYVQEVKFYDDTKVGDGRQQFRMWKSIQNVNKKLRQYCEQKKGSKKIIFFDATDIFLQKDENGVAYIPQNMMLNFFHPSVAGYRAWAEKITEVLDEIVDK